MNEKQEISARKSRRAPCPL